ncbi:MAG: glycosyltransferase family 4 protein [Sphingomonadales bacterium]
MRVLTFTTLFPNSAQPNFGVFVENRLRHLMAYGRIEARVIAPVPYFPFKMRFFGTYAAYANAPLCEERHGLQIYHPRYMVLPKIGMYITPSLLFKSALKTAWKLQEEGFDFDLIDAHYFYPDGVAAAKLARTLGKPLLITARGTDINLIPQYARARKLILEAGEQADEMIAVCQALKDEMIKIGLDGRKITVLRNGVDLEMFTPKDRTAAKVRFKTGNKTLVSVGALIERKGHHLTIDALASLKGYELLIAGDGPEKARLQAQARANGVADRVRFLGRVPHEDLAWLYSAADASVLASSREGWANVLLESMACGTPVVASNLWGTPECVAVPEAGVLMEDYSAKALAKGVEILFQNLPDRALTRAYAEKFNWDATSQGQLDIMHRVCGR